MTGHRWTGLKFPSALQEGRGHMLPAALWMCIPAACCYCFNGRKLDWPWTVAKFLSWPSLKLFSNRFVHIEHSHAFFPFPILHCVESLKKIKTSRWIISLDFIIKWKRQPTWITNIPTGRNRARGNSHNQTKIKQIYTHDNTFTQTDRPTVSWTSSKKSAHNNIL